LFYGERTLIDKQDLINSMLSLKLIEETHLRLLKKIESQDIDLSKIKTVADLKKAYLIRKIIEKELIKINPNIEDSLINRLANIEIEKRIIKNYEIEKVPHQEREAQPYYSKDVHYMITETPWKCVSNEFLKFTKSDDFIDQYNSDQNRLVEFALRGTYQ
jgi:hypothetical protein